ncbi:MAG: peptide ABC transporter substrate-binding protein [Anaerolineales bacterium]|nr:peptide ABC transporter substrate-binding protein [Anaerolineales bacterium]
MNILYSGMWFGQLAIDLMQLSFWQFDDAKDINLELAAELPTKENGGISEDGLTITIPLREDALWTDGTPVTAHDYVFTYEMEMADGNAVQSRYPFDTFVESITALDDYTVQVVMNAPYVGWTVGFDVPFLPKHILEPVFQADGTIDNADWNRDLSVTNGPFKLKEWESASHLILEANDDYWRGRPSLDQIFIRIVPDDEAQMAAIKAGDIDIGVYLTAADKPDIDELTDVELLNSSGGWVESWFFNTISEELGAENDLQPGHVGLQDKLVRRAIVMGFDRAELIDNLFYGLYRIPAVFWYESPYDDTSIEPWPYDPEGAMTLLDESGWVDSNGDGTRDKDGVELVIQYSTTAGNELRESTGLIFQQSMAEIGVGVEILNYSYDVMWNGYGDDGPAARGEYDIVEWSTQGADFPDPNLPDWLCEEIPSADYPAGANWQGVCMEELDDLFAQQAVTVDQEARIQLFHEIEDIMHDEMFWMGVRTDDDFWALNNRLLNVIFSGVDAFWNVYEWDVAQ